MKRIVTLTENDVKNLVKESINEIEKGSNHRRSKFEGDLYHKDVWMPKVLRSKAFEYFKTFKQNTKLNDHIKLNQGCDDCHTYDIPTIEQAIKNVDPFKANIFEIGTEYSLDGQPNTTIRKFAVRMPYDDQYDVIVVYSTDPESMGAVKTAWLNRRNDCHHTLDSGRYTRPTVRMKR